jgi:hypothetical protein
LSRSRFNKRRGEVNETNKRDNLKNDEFDAIKKRKRVNDKRHKDLIWNSIWFLLIFRSLFATCACDLHSLLLSSVTLLDVLFCSSLFTLYFFDDRNVCVCSILHSFLFTCLYDEECWEKCGSKHYLILRRMWKNWKIDNNLTSLKFERIE